MSPQERLKWLEENQPRNVSAINAIRSKLGMELLAAPKKKARNWRDIVAGAKGKRRGLRITPCHHWVNRGASSN